MTFDEYQGLARRTQNKDLTGEQLLNHALWGLCSEVGEIHGIFQKHLQGHPMEVLDVRKEIGDTLWFVSELCDALFMDIGQIAEENIEKLKRRYPDGFSEDRSVNREE